MVSFSVPFVTVVLLAFSHLCGVMSLPTGIGEGARDSMSRAKNAAPRWVIYSDKWAAQPPDVSQLSGFNALSVLPLF